MKISAQVPRTASSRSDPDVKERLFVQWSLVGLVLLGASTLPITAQAQVPLTENLVVPYTGVVDQDGIPFDGQTQLRFRLLTVAQGGAAPAEPCAPAAGCLWEEAHPRVAVHGGAFSVLLGRPVGAPGVPIGPLLKADVQYFLEVAIGPVGANGWTTLGRQAIHPAPAAVWSAPSNLDLNRLTVATADVGALHATTGTLDHVDAADVQATDITASGSLTAPAFTATGAGQKLNNVFTFEPPCGTYYRIGVTENLCHRPVAGRICWMSNYIAQGLTTPNSLAQCAVSRDENNWFVHIWARENGGVSCEMSCVTY